MRPRTWPLKSMSGGALALVVTGGIGGAMSMPFWLGWGLVVLSLLLARFAKEACSTYLEAAS